MILHDRICPLSDPSGPCLHDDARGGSDDAQPLTNAARCEAAAATYIIKHKMRVHFAPAGLVSVRAKEAESGAKGHGGVVLPPLGLNNVASLRVEML